MQKIHNFYSSNGELLKTEYYEESSEEIIEPPELEQPFDQIIDALLE